MKLNQQMDFNAVMNGAAGVVIALVLALGAPLLVGAQTGAGEIESFTADAVLQDDGTIQVTEQITYDFGNSYATGFTRVLPLAVERSVKQDTAVGINIERVTRDGLEESYGVVRQNGTFYMETGQESIPLQGLHDYVVEYHIVGAVVSEPEMDTFVLPFEFRSPVTGAEIHLTLPATSGFARVQCQLVTRFTRECPVRRQAGSSETEGAVFVAQVSSVPVGAQVQLVAEMSSGTVVLDEIGATVAEYLENPPMYFELFVLIATLLILITVLWFLRRRTQRRRHRDLSPRSAPPRAVRPIHVGMFVDGQVHPSDLVAALLQLVHSGKLKIEAVDGADQQSSGANTATPDRPADYQLTLRKGLAFIPDAPEQTLLELLFGANAKQGTTMMLSNLMNSTVVAQGVKRLENAVRHDLIEIGYRRSLAQVRRWGFVVFGVLTVVLSLLIAVAGDFALPASLAVIAIGTSLIFLGVVHSPWTEGGRRARTKLRAFGYFLTLNAQQRRVFPRLGDRTPSDFTRLLPFAVALDIVDRWADQFTHMYVDPPYWYPVAEADRSISHGIAGEIHRFNAVFETWFGLSQQARKDDVSDSSTATSKEMFAIRDFDDYVTDK